MNNAKAIVKQYRVTRGCLLAVLLAVVFLTAFLVREIRYMLAIYAVALLAARMIRVHLYQKYITSILTVECDPVKYKAVLEEGKILSRSAMESVLAAYYTGDYQSTVDICCRQLQDKKAAKHKCFYLSFLARVYFTVGDEDKLRSVCEAFEHTVSASPKEEQLRRDHLAFRFYSLYLQEDFAACKALSEACLADQGHMSTPFQEGHTRFTYGISCYKCGDPDTARQQLALVAEKLPLFPLAGISRQYLEAMESGREYRPEFVDLLPTEGFTMPQHDALIKRVRIIRITGAVVAVAAAIGAAAIVLLSGGKHDARIRAAVAAVYDEFEVAGVLDVAYDDQPVTTVCVCDTAQDGLIVGMLYTYEDTETVYLYTAYTNIEVGRVHYMETIPEGYMLAFGLYEDTADIPADAYQTTEIEVDGNTGYFSVLTVYPDESVTE